MKLYRPTDRITIKIGDATFSVSPLTYDQKIEVQTIISEGSSGYKITPKAIYDSSLLALRYGLKEVSGIDDFELDIKDGVVTEESAKDLLYAEENEAILTSCNLVATGKFTYLPEGVEIINPKKKGKRKK